MDIDSNLETITPITLTTLTIGSTGGVVAPSGTTAQRPGTPVSGTLRYNTTTTLIEIYQNGTWINMGQTSPATPTTSVQFNNAGVFGGSANFIWNNTTNALDIITGTLAQNRMRLGGSTNVGTATLYIETDGTNNEGQRVYFNNAGAPATSGFITYAYDTATPYIAVIDNDDDAPYITFQTTGTGTFAAPLYVSAFGARGNNGTRTLGANSGFAWYVGASTSAAALITAGTPVMELDTQFLTLPTGTTANRPGTPANGMIRYNTTLGRIETYEGVAWVTSAGVLDKSTTAVTVNVAAATNIFSYSVPGGTLGTDGILRLTINGTWNNTSGNARTSTLLVSYGGTTLWSSITPSLANGTRTSFTIELFLAANNSASAQTLTGRISFGPTGASSTGTGFGPLSTTVFAEATVFGTSAFASAGAGTFLVSAAFSGTNANFVKQIHTLERL